MNASDQSCSTAPQHGYELSGKTLTLRGRKVLNEIDDEIWTLSNPMHGAAAIISAEVTPRSFYVELPLGKINSLKRFTSSARNGPFWLNAVNGTSEEQLQAGTLWMLCELEDNRFLIIAPILGKQAVYTLSGQENGLIVQGENGDPETTINCGPHLYMEVGLDPYKLLKNAADCVSQHSIRGSTPVNLPAPDFIDYFGWCTWDAFYQSVSDSKVTKGLQSFSEIGIEPRLLILDDGWQTTKQQSTGEERLSGLEPNERFGKDLGPLIQKSKNDYKVKRFLVWHALLGYWGGLDSGNLSKYSINDIARSYGPSVLARNPYANVKKWGALVGVPNHENIPDFYNDYHSLLATQGVDGVKVDSQGTLESLANGQGGRCKIARDYREALEGSVQTNFEKRMINCMSATPECLYLAQSGIMRTSDDFWPDQPETHGRHIYTNAHTSLWFGHFVYVDWDMFQSGHDFGSYHAAARAISGGPVYVSDKPNGHDKKVLQSLVLSNGTILRADHAGLLSPDSLFTDPTEEKALLKIFNTNNNCGVIGVFNAQSPNSEDVALSTTISLADIPTLQGQEYMAYTFKGRSLHQCSSQDHFEISLKPGQWEIVTLAPVENQFSAIGLSDKLNSSAAILACYWMDDKTCRLTLRDGGVFLAWSLNEPLSVTCKETNLQSDYNNTSGMLRVEVPIECFRVIDINWP